MPKYRIAETYACWVTWEREIEADSPEQAQELHDNGEGKLVNGPEIGDIVDGYDIRTEFVDSLGNPIASAV